MVNTPYYVIGLYEIYEAYMRVTWEQFCPTFSRCNLHDC